MMVDSLVIYDDNVQGAVADPSLTSTALKAINPLTKDHACVVWPTALILSQKNISFILQSSTVLFHTLCCSKHDKPVPLLYYIYMSIGK